MENWENEKESLNYKKTTRKGLGDTVEKMMNKLYKPNSRVDTRFRSKDIAFFTNENGEPIKLFIGKRKSDGNIVGQLFDRKIKKTEAGLIKESHWDNKGKVS